MGFPNLFGWLEDVIHPTDSSQSQNKSVGNVAYQHGAPPVDNKPNKTNSYGAGFTTSILHTVDNVVHNVEKTIAEHIPKRIEKPLEPLGDFAKTATNSFVNTLGAGVGFVADTAAQEAKAAKALAHGNVSKAAQEGIVKPIRATVAGTIGLLNDIGKRSSRVLYSAGKDFFLNTKMLHALATGNQKEAKQTAKAILKTSKQGLHAGGALLGTVAGLWTLGKTGERASTAFGNVKLRVQSKISKDFIPAEKTGIKWVNDVTIPKTRRQLLSNAGKEVTAIHISDHPALNKAIKSGTFKLKGASAESMTPYRFENDMRHFYVSAPDKGKPVAYLGYSSEIPHGKLSSGESPIVEFRLTKPGTKALVFKQKVAKVPTGILRDAKRAAKDPFARRRVIQWQGKQSGKITPAAENLFGESIEGQYIIPAEFEGFHGKYPGSIVEITGKKGWTIYEAGKATKLTDAGKKLAGTLEKKGHAKAATIVRKAFGTANKTWDITKELTGGKKLARIDIYEAKAHPVNTPFVPKNTKESLDILRRYTRSRRSRGRVSPKTSRPAEISELRISSDYYRPRVYITPSDVARTSLFTSGAGLISDIRSSKPRTSMGIISSSRKSSPSKLRNSSPIRSVSPSKPLSRGSSPKPSRSSPPSYRSSPPPISESPPKSPSRSTSSSPRSSPALLDSMASKAMFGGLLGSAKGKRVEREPVDYGFRIIKHKVGNLSIFGGKRNKKKRPSLM